MNHPADLKRRVECVIGCARYVSNTEETVSVGVQFSQIPKRMCNNHSSASRSQCKLDALGFTRTEEERFYAGDEWNETLTLSAMRTVTADMENQGN